jgi:hypothetical protein
MGLRKVAIALMVALIALSALVPLALYGQPARALNTVSNVSVAVSVYPISFYMCNGSKVVIRLAEAWAYNQSAGPAMASGLFKTPSGTMSILSMSQL